MNKWFRLALFAFIGVIALNLILNLFFRPTGYGYNDHTNMYNNYYGQSHMQQQMPMHNGMNRMGGMMK